MNVMVGKNTDFVVVFDAHTQKYNVYYKGNLLISKYRFVDVKSYLN